MKSMIQSYIGSKTPAERSKLELENLIPWFRKHGKGILRDASDAMLVDILQNCFLKSYNGDEIIILQGDIGDKFYIVVHGEVSVYVNDIGDPSKERIFTSNHLASDKDVLNLLGKCVAVGDVGYTFGEYAMFDENNMRKASVVSTTETLLVVIPKEIYNQCLKNLQQNRIDERKHFVDNNPLFSDWNPRLKSMLVMSLRKIHISYQSNLVTQGDEWSGIHFITSGSGQLVIDPNKHEHQFPQFYPLNFDSYDKRYQEFPELKPQVSSSNINEGSSADRLMPKHIKLKRTGNYVALETHFLNNKHLVCAIQPGEIVGDLEFMFNLQHNLCSVVCTEEIEAFLLDLTIIERLLKRINFDVIHGKLKSIIQSKMDHREKYFKDVPVPLLMLLKFNLYDQPITNIRLLPELKTKKKLPDEGMEWQHLLKMYQDGKASLCRPYVKGGVFLKDLMKRNADDRQSILAANQRELDEIQVQNSLDVIDSKFPISQNRIYELQKIVPNSLVLLEMIYDEIQNFNLSKKARDKRFNTIPYSARVPRNQLSVVTDDGYDRGRSKDNKFCFHRHSEIDEPVLATKDRLKRAYMKYKSKINPDFLTTNESLTLLQNAQVKFLNSLCSEKSVYAIKVNSLPNSNRENKKTHFLPILKSQNDVIQNGNIPKKGARVLVKRHRCIALNTSYTLLNHVHDRFQMVDKLEWNNVEKLQGCVSEFLKMKYKKSLSE